MSTIRVSLITDAATAPSRVELPAIPRIGDHLKLTQDSTYEVTRVVWDVHSAMDDLLNTSNIQVFLKPALVV